MKQIAALPKLYREPPDWWPLLSAPRSSDSVLAVQLVSGRLRRLQPQMLGDRAILRVPAGVSDLQLRCSFRRRGLDELPGGRCLPRQ